MRVCMSPAVAVFAIAIGIANLATGRNRRKLGFDDAACAGDVVAIK